MKTVSRRANRLISILLIFAMLTGFFTPFGARPQAYAEEPGAQPDLTVGDIAVAPAEPVAGQAATVTAAVYNGGSADSGAFTTALYIDGNETPHETQTTASLGCGRTQTVHFTWTPPSAGAYSLKIAARGVTGVAEADESNNEGSITVHVLAEEAGGTVAVESIAVLTGEPEALEPAQTIEAGSTYTVQVTVKNGTEAAAAALIAALYEVRGETPKAVGEVQTVASLAADESVTLAFAWTPAEEGDCTLKAVVTGEGVSAELDSAELSVAATPAPVNDVVLDKHRLPLKVGETGMLTATVLPESPTNPTVTWVSADEQVATIEDGLVTAVGVGETVITATADGVSDTCSVIVYEAGYVAEAVNVSVSIFTAVGLPHNHRPFRNREVMTVLPGYAGSFGYETVGLNVYADKATVFDALAHASEERYKDFFRADPLSFLQINPTGTLKRFLDTNVGSTYQFGVVINGRPAAANIDTVVLEEGDEVSLFWYDGRAGNNYQYAFFEDSEGNAYPDRLEVNAGESVTLTLKGYSYKDALAAGAAPEASPLTGVPVGTTFRRGHLSSSIPFDFKQLGEQVTDAEGKATFTFAKAGYYLVSANGGVTVDGVNYSVIQPQCLVIVKDDADAGMTNPMLCLDFETISGSMLRDYLCNGTPMFGGEEKVWHHIRMLNLASFIENPRLTGEAAPGSTVTVEGEPASVDEKGYFYGEVEADWSVPSYRIYTVAVTSKDASTTKTYKLLVIYKPDSNNVMPNITGITDPDGAEIRGLHAFDRDGLKVYDGEYGESNDGDRVNVTGHYDHITGIGVANTVEAVRVNMTIANALLEAVRTRKVLQDGTLSDYTDGSVDSVVLDSFTTAPLFIDKGHNWFLIETKRADSEVWTSHGVLHIYRQQTEGLSADVTLTPENLMITDALGTEITPVWNEDDKYWDVPVEPAGTQQNKVVFKLLSQPEGASIRIGSYNVQPEGTVTISLPVTPVSFYKEYKTTVYISVTPGNQLGTTFYNYRVVRQPEPPSADNASLLDLLGARVMNAAGSDISGSVPYRAVSVTDDSQINTMSAQLTASLVSISFSEAYAKKDIYYIAASTPARDDLQASIANLIISPVPVFAGMGATYTCAVNGVTLASRASGGTLTIPHTGGTTFAGRDVTRIDITVHPPANVDGASDKTYSFIVPKIPSTEVDVTNITVAKARTSDSNGRPLYNHSGGFGDENKTAFSKTVYDYDLKVDYESEYLYFLPTLAFPDVEVSWKLNGQPMEPDGSVTLSGVDGIAPIEVGSANTIAMTFKMKNDTTGESAKTYTFHVTREVNCDADFTFSDNVGIVGNTNVSQLSGIKLGYDPAETEFDLTVAPQEPGRQVTIMQDGAVLASGTDATTAAGVSLYKAVNVTITDETTNAVRTYTVAPYAYASNAPSRIYALMPAPGQFLNSSWSGFDDVRIVGSIGQPDGGNPGGSGGGSLGTFGGYVVYQYSDPILNSPNNKYGADFWIGGNAFPANNEPAAVKVAQDKDGDGEPDKDAEGNELWYDLAGSMHYDDGTIWDYEATYYNANPDFMPYVAENVTFTDNYGNSGTAVYANGFHGQVYYPDGKVYSYEGNNAQYSAEQMTYSGVLLDAVNRGGRSIPVRFGYADCAGSSVMIPIELGNPYRESQAHFDIDWAVDKDGNPVHLDEVSFVWIYSATMYDRDATGELSPEIMGIGRLDKDGASAVGQTPKPGSVVLQAAGFDDIILDDSLLPEHGGVLELNVGERPFVRTVINSHSNDAMFVNNDRVTSGSDKAPSLSVTAGSERLVRIIVQRGTMEAYICLLRLSGSAQQADTLLTGLKMERYGSEIAVSRDGNYSYSASVPYTCSFVRVVPTVKAGATVTVDGVPLGQDGKSQEIALTTGETKNIVIEVNRDGETEVTALAVTRAEGEGAITVTFTLLGDSIHGESGPRHIYKNDPESFEVWISREAHTVPAGSAVKDVFEKALSEAGLGYVNPSGNYVSSIQCGDEWLSEFSNGRFSGWMYTVNGTHPMVGLQYYVLEDGDDIVWHYTDDYRYEEGSEHWLVGAVLDPAAASFDKNPANQADVTAAITWNDAEAVTDVKAGGISIGQEHYSVGADTLIIKKDYLAARPSGSLELTVEFDFGAPATLTVNITDTSGGGGIGFDIERVGESDFELGADARVILKITNNNPEPRQATLIVCLYDNERSGMANYSYLFRTLAVGEEVELAGGFRIPETGDYSVKAFVWDSFENMEPLLEDPLVIEVN